MSNTPEYRARRAAQARAWRKANPQYKEKRNKKRRLLLANPEKRARHQARGRKSRAKNWPELRARINRRNELDRISRAGRPKPDICDACGQPHKRIVLDHCHQRGHFRGWLCNPCNVILGHARDDPSILLKLVAYLKRTSNGVSRQMSLPGI